MNIVHCKRSTFDVYVGRPGKPTPWHWGNPFSHKAGTLAAVKVATAEEAVQAFEDWLDGTVHLEIEPERRLWILNSLPSLAGKVLGCWCVTPEAPDAPCHGRSLARRASGAVEAMDAFAAPGEPLSYVWQDGKRVHICTVLGEGLSEWEQEKYNRLRAEARRLHPEYYEVKK